MKVYLLCAIAACTAALGVFGDAQKENAITFQKGPWELSIDRTNGVWQKLSWAGDDILNNCSQLPPFNWGPDWDINKGTNIFALASSDFDKETGTLRLRYRGPDWKVEEIVVFGAQGRADRLGLSLRLTYDPKFKTKEPAKFKDVVINVSIPKQGRFLLPAYPAFTSEGDLATLSKGSRRANGSIWPMLFEQTKTRTLIFMPDARTDVAKITFQAGSEDVCVQNTSKACGWAYPGEPQTIGPFYLEVFPAGLDRAFKEGVWRLFDEIGLKARSDTPAWVKDAVLYCFFPGGSVKGDYQDLGGFAAARTELLPQLANLGIDAAFIMPVHDGSCYSPRDYYKLAKELGDEKEFAALVDAAHGYGMKVWLDIVPHGGKPGYGELRGNKPWELVFDENGDALDYWCFDFGNPDWQIYIGEVADKYASTYKLDGFRIDACEGSHIPNWRKKDFPSLAHTPKNVPETWWQKELAATGGLIPPLPYARASLAQRQGGLEMDRAIRAAVKCHNPMNGAVLGEFDGAPYMQENDVLYDFRFYYDVFVRLFKTTSPDEFAPGLARWLEEQKYAEPRGTIRMRYLDIHRPVYSKDWVGLDAAKAMRAVTLLIDGMPMIYVDSEVGTGVFLKRLIAIRKALPELRRGDADYSTASTKSVFACVRSAQDLHSVALVNLGPDAAGVALPIPKPILERKEKTAVWDCESGTLVATALPADLRSTKINLKPWGYAVLAFRNPNEPCPVPPLDPVPAEQTTYAGKHISVKDSADSLEIHAPQYSLVIAKKTGLLTRFSDSKGHCLLEHAGVFVPSITFSNDSALPCDAKITEAVTERKAEVHVVASLPSGGKMKLVYNCFPDAVKLAADLEGNDKSQQVGLTFASPDVKRWQINTAEGLLDDFYSIRHAQGTTRAPRNWFLYRAQGTPLLWQSRTVPLDLANPALCAFHDSGGVQLSVESPLEHGPANTLVLDRLGSQASWHCAFLWRDVSDTERFGGNPVEHFAIVLKPTSQPLVDRDTAEPFRLGDLQLRNESKGWHIENRHYSVNISRTGGLITGLSAKGQRVELLAGNEILGEHGFKTPYVDTTAVASEDAETGVRVWSEGKDLHLVFSGWLRSKKESEKLRPRTCYSIAYTFTPSALIHVAYGVLCEQPLPGSSYDLCWTAGSPQWDAYAVSSGGQVTTGPFNTAFSGKATSAQSRIAKPDAIQIRAKDGKRLISFTGMKHSADAPEQSVLVGGSKISFTIVDKKTAPLKSGQWHEFSMDISADPDDDHQMPTVPTH